MLPRRSLALLLFSTSLLGCADASRPQGEAGLRAALAQQEAAWNRHDAKAWVAPFSEDAEFINILGMKLEGRPEIERRHAEIFGGIFAHSKVEVTTRKVRSLGATAALVETDYALTGYDRLPPGIRPTDADGTLRTRLKYVWQLTHDGWRVVAAQNTAIFPLPVPRP
jgi:uncharacterized protein (TIGR02246 family)